MTAALIVLCVLAAAGLLIAVVFLVLNR